MMGSSALVCPSGYIDGMSNSTRIPTPERQYFQPRAKPCIGHDVPEPIHHPETSSARLGRGGQWIWVQEMPCRERASGKARAWIGDVVQDGVAQGD